MQGLTLTNGSDSGGGAIRVVDDENLTIRDSVLTGNTANTGGALYATTYGVVRILGSRFDTNTANQNGGAASLRNGTAEVTGSTFTGNTAGFYGGGLEFLYSQGIVISQSTISMNMAGADGGGINFNTIFDSILIDNTTISGNTADSDGGGFYGYALGVGNTLTVLNSRILNNTATNGDGGGFNIDELEGRFRVIDTTVTGNTAAGEGGGGYVDNDGDAAFVEVINSKFITNEATGSDGGGLLLHFNDGTIQISDTLFDRNTAGSDGGGLSIDNQTNSTLFTTIERTTFTGNIAAQDGGGLDFYNNGVLGSKSPSATRPSAGHRGRRRRRADLDGIDGRAPFGSSGRPFADNRRLSGSGGGGVEIEINGGRVVLPPVTITDRRSPGTRPGNRRRPQPLRDDGFDGGAVIANDHLGQPGRGRWRRRVLPRRRRDHALVVTNSTISGTPRPRANGGGDLLLLATGS